MLEIKTYIISTLIRLGYSTLGALRSRRKVINKTIKRLETWCKQMTKEAHLGRPVDLINMR